MVVYTVSSSGADCKSVVFDSGGATPSTTTIYVPVIQPVEIKDLKSFQFGFESRGEHQNKCFKRKSKKLWDCIEFEIYMILTEDVRAADEKVVFKNGLGL